MQGKSGRTNAKKENQIPEEAYAPYNFVPFSNKVIRRYESVSALPDYGKIDPKLKTGEIEITLETETPIYVSNGSKEKTEEDFFKGADGSYQIPSSSIRGMLRENMQILGFGLIRPEEDIADYHIYFREMASSNGKGDKSAKKYYRNTVNVGNGAIPQNVQAGYIRNCGGKYYLKESRYIRISRRHPDLDAIKGEKGIPVARTWNVLYIPQKDENDNDIGIKTITFSKYRKNGMKEGTLLSTGKYVDKPNPLYVFEKEDMQEMGIYIEQKDILAYTEDLENRKNAAKSYREFWKLPKPGESKPVFYIKIGDCLYWGMSLFVRIGYPHIISEGLPEIHKEYNEKEKKELILDYPYSMLGFAREKMAYRSRVSIGNFQMIQGTRTRDEYCIIGGEPRPSYYLGYLNGNTSYANDKFSLRGYKQYWQRENADEKEKPDNSNMYKMVHPFEKGSKFKGTIRFKNLYDDELGLLLWSLLLKEGCYQSIGTGKPYGMGRIKVTINALREFSICDSYNISGFCNAFQIKDDNAIEKYIECYKHYATNILSNSSDSAKKIEEYGGIQDFFFIHKPSPLAKEEMDYMNLTGYQKAKKSLKTLQDIRANFENTDSAGTESVDNLLKKWGMPSKKKDKHLKNNRWRK